MHLRAKPPIFVPLEFRAEIETLSKAALMDLVWDLAATATIGSDPKIIMRTVRQRAEIVRLHRRNA